MIKRYQIITSIHRENGASNLFLSDTYTSSAAALKTALEAVDRELQDEQEDSNVIGLSVVVTPQS